MPWSSTTPMDQKTKFIADHLRGTFSISELCTTYGISRKTGYKWIDRYLHDGPAGLEDQSRKPYAAPNRTPQHVVDALIDVRAHHPTWGAGKLLAFIEKRHRGWELPARSTACEILKRHGLVAKRRNRRRIGHPGQPTTPMLAPNDCWCADFKGQFKTMDGLYCYPLTVTDGHSRFLLACQGLTSTKVEESKPVFTRLFKEYGLPLASAPTTACRSPPIRSPGSRTSRPGGCALAYCPSSSSQASRSRTGVMSACIGP